MDPFDTISQFEQALAAYTGAPYCVAVDCCTHAIELAMRYDRVQRTEFTAWNYISVVMVMHKLGIEYQLLDEPWTGQYPFHGTRIIDSARRLSASMYQPGTMTCVSFGRGKPLDLHRGGAILLDDPVAQQILREQRYDGRDLSILPWPAQQRFRVGYHYKMTPDEAAVGLQRLSQREFNTDQLNWTGYPDCRTLTIYD